MTNDSVLGRAYKIVEERNEEKTRQYGTFKDSIEKTATIASAITSKDITPNDVFAVLTALKLSRISHSMKTKNDLPDNDDSVLDACAYLGAWQNYSNNKKK